MDAFPESYVAHNIPLVALSGIKLPSHGSRSNKEERGELGSQFGSLDTDAAAQLLHEFLRYDGSSVAWNSRSRRSREDLIPLKIQPVGPVCARSQTYIIRHKLIHRRRSSSRPAKPPRPPPRGKPSTKPPMQTTRR